MAEDKELSQLEAVTNPSANDLMYIVSGGNSRKIPYGNVFPKDNYYTKTQMDTALAGKEPTISVTANRALVSDANGKVSASSATSEEVGYLSGVTGAIQTQIDGKADKTYVDGQGAKTVSGNPITLTDAEAMNADHVVATITPTQTGSGTPSPSNVRPFVGFSSVNIAISKKNIINTNQSEWEKGTYSNDGSEETATSKIRTKWDNYIRVVPNETYTFSIDGANYQYYFFAYDENDLVVSEDSRNSAWLSSDTTITIQSAKRIRIAIKNTYTGGDVQPSDAIVSKIQAEIGSQATTYEPYQGDTYTVQLGDTYYQAEIDLTDGKIKCNYWSALINDLNCVREGTLGRFWIRSSDLSNIIVKATSVTDVVDVRCEVYEKETSGDIWGGTTGIGVTTEGDLWLSCPSNITTVEDYKAQYGSYRILYPLATPIEIQLTPQQIALLENNNTITTNVSSLDITYQTNNGIGDTASALDKRVTSLETKVPQPPTTDGTYKLTVTVASGTPTYSWESAT